MEKAALRYGYDPGCSRPAGGEPDDDTVLAVARALGLALEEIGEPGGCGTGALAMNGIPAYARVGRMLALAARRLAGAGGGGVPPSVVSPCSACVRTLGRANRSLLEHPELREQVAEELAATGLSLAPGSVRVRHLLDVLLEDVGVAAIRARVRRPFARVRVAPYYGCFAVRGGDEEPARDDPTPPGRLEGLLSALGAEVVGLPLRDHCCGGRAAEASEETASSLQHRILRAASEAGAAVLVVVCTRCRRNLEAGQEPVNRRYRTSYSIPVRHFAGLLAEAFGLGVRS